jgi:hypothetical protein
MTCRVCAVGRGEQQARKLGGRLEIRQLLDQGEPFFCSRVVISTCTSSGELQRAVNAEPVAGDVGSSRTGCGPLLASAISTTEEQRSSSPAEIFERVGRGSMPQLLSVQGQLAVDALRKRVLQLQDDGCSRPATLEAADSQRPEQPGERPLRSAR